MEKSDSIKNLAVALGKFQASMGKIVKSESNPFFKSKYASLPNILEAIQKPMEEAKLSFTQMPVGDNELCTFLMHETGEYFKSTYRMIPTKNDPQGLGSAITYQRRYALGAILGLNIDEDDDGNKASEPPKEKAIDVAKKFINGAKTEIILNKCLASVESSKEFSLAEKNQLKKLVEIKRLALMPRTIPVATGN